MIIRNLPEVNSKYFLISQWYLPFPVTEIQTIVEGFDNLDDAIARRKQLTHNESVDRVSNILTSVENI